MFLAEFDKGRNKVILCKEPLGMLICKGNYPGQLVCQIQERLSIILTNARGVVIRPI